MSTSSMRKFKHRQDWWSRRLILSLILLLPCLCVFSHFVVLKRALEPVEPTHPHRERTQTFPGYPAPPLVPTPPLSAKWSTTPPAPDNNLRHFSLDSAVPEHQTATSTYYDDSDNKDYAQQLLHARTIAPRSLTVILPVTSQALSHLESTILSLHQDPGAITEIIVLAYEPIISLTRRTLRTLITTVSPNPDNLFPIEITLRSWQPELTQSEALLKCVAQIGYSGTSEWVVVLDERYFEDVGEEMKRMLLNPLNVTFPFGLKGSGSGGRETRSFAGLRGFEVDEVSGGLDGWEQTKAPHPVSFLIPPFVLPTRLFGGDNDKEGLPAVDSKAMEDDIEPHLRSWAAFGQWVSSTSTDKIGGVVLGSVASSSSGYCPAQHEKRDISGEHWAIGSAATLALPSESATLLRPSGVFGILMFSPEDLLRFSSTVCRLMGDGHRVEVLLYGQGGRRGALAPDLGDRGGMFVEGSLTGFGQCAFSYRSVVDTEISRDRALGLWLDSFTELPDVLVASVVDERLDSALVLALKERKLDQDTTLIQLPRKDLPYTDWMGTLSLQEWKSKL